MKLNILTAFAVIAISGCATTGLYDWGNYEDDLFDYYHQPENKEKVIADLVEHLEEIQSRGMVPAPGLLAEAGTFYLLEGDSEKAVEFYKLEAAAWPESEPMMAKLIRNLEK